MSVVKLLGGIFPDKLVIPKLPSAENSVNFKPVVVPSDSIVNKDLPVLSDTFSFPAEMTSIISPFDPWNSPAPGLASNRSLACAAVSLPPAL